MVYSTEMALTRALDVKLRRAKQLAKTLNPDFKKNHPSEFRDLNLDKVTESKTRIQKEFDDFKTQQQLRREKYGKRI